MEEHQRRRQAILPRLLIPASLALLRNPLHPAHLLYQPTRTLSPPSANNLLNDIEEWCESLSVDKIFVEARFVERAEVVKVREVGGGEGGGGRGGENGVDDALRKMISCARGWPALRSQIEAKHSQMMS